MTNDPRGKAATKPCRILGFGVIVFLAVSSTLSALQFQLGPYIADDPALTAEAGPANPAANGAEPDAL